MPKNRLWSERQNKESAEAVMGVYRDANSDAVAVVVSRTDGLVAIKWTGIGLFEDGRWKYFYWVIADRNLIAKYADGAWSDWKATSCVDNQSWASGALTPLPEGFNSLTMEIVDLVGCRAVRIENV